MRLAFRGKMSGDAHARPGHGQESGSQPISSQPRKAFVLPRSFKSLRSPVKAPQKLLEGLRVLSTIAIYTLTAAILLVYCYLIATKGGAHLLKCRSTHTPCRFC